MNRQDKQEVINALKYDFATNVGSFLIECQGLTVADMQILRKKLRAQGGKMHIAKARLMRLAAQEVKGVEQLDSYFKNQVAIVFATEHPTAVAKVLEEASKENKKLVIVAGYVASRLLDQEGIRFVASIPSRDVLLSQLVGLLEAPISQFVQMLDLTCKALEQSKQ